MLNQFNILLKRYCEIRNELKSFQGTCSDIITSVVTLCFKEVTTEEGQTCRIAAEEHIYKIKWLTVPALHRPLALVWNFVFKPLQNQKCLNVSSGLNCVIICSKSSLICLVNYLTTLQLNIFNYFFLSVPSTEHTFFVS